ncbi:golgin subfamily A member 4-like [Diorhabda carinulata]|uniref:golgin subfamily A member 4-like n=1 Tax=Diorhabda carinulata TaxID=1163345 RepID=UPI0025A0452B|nr:golgin subfamily A member 4-like [Diorhabda carinulata]
MSTKHKKSRNTEEDSLKCEECNKQNEPNDDKSSIITESTKPKSSDVKKTATKKSKQHKGSDLSRVTEKVFCEECEGDTEKTIKKSSELFIEDSEENGSFHGKVGGKKSSFRTKIEETTEEEKNVSEEKQTEEEKVTPSKEETVQKEEASSALSSSATSISHTTGSEAETTENEEKEETETVKSPETLENTEISERTEEFTAATTRKHKSRSPVTVKATEESSGTLETEEESETAMVSTEEHKTKPSAIVETTEISETFPETTEIEEESETAMASTEEHKTKPSAIVETTEISETFPETTEIEEESETAMVSTEEHKTKPSAIVETTEISETLPETTEIEEESETAMASTEEHKTKPSAIVETTEISETLPETTGIEEESETAMASTEEHKTKPSAIVETTEISETFPETTELEEESETAMASTEEHKTKPSAIVETTEISETFPETTGIEEESETAMASSEEYETSTTTEETKTKKILPETTKKLKHTELSEIVHETFQTTKKHTIIEDKARTRTTATEEIATNTMKTGSSREFLTGMETSKTEEEIAVTEEYKTHKPESKKTKATEVESTEVFTAAKEITAAEVTITEEISTEKIPKTKTKLVENEQKITKEHTTHSTVKSLTVTKQIEQSIEKIVTTSTEERGEEGKETTIKEEEEAKFETASSVLEENQTEEMINLSTQVVVGSQKTYKHGGMVVATEPFLMTLSETESSTTHATEIISEESIPDEVTASEENIVLLTAVEETNHTEKSVVEESTIRSTPFVPIPTPEAEETTKIMVIIVNNSGKKMKKMNESVLEKLVNKKMQEINLEYVDMYDLLKEHKTTNKSENTDLVYKETVIGDGKKCKASEFNANVHCPCDVDNYLHSLEGDLAENMDITNLNCSKMISFHDGFLITNKTQPLKRKKRSLLYLKSLGRSSNVIESNNVDEVLDKDYDINTGTDVLVYPNRKAKIYCGSVADKLIETDGVTFKWEFIKDGQDSPDILPISDNPLVIQNADTKTAGNYSCTRTNKEGDEDNYTHELELITFPIYKIKLEVFYWVNDSCSLADGDILFAYLPKMAGPLLCGSTGKLCKVDVLRPVCITDDDDTFYNVTLTVTMNDIYDIYPMISDEKCNINCRFKTYANLIYLVDKNARIVKNIPVLSRLEHNLDFLSNVTLTDKNRPPKIITTCRGGYGIERYKQRICVICPKHTFSPDDEAFCKMCPAGQYQPQPGLQSCIPCKSPVDDAMCLRMLYSDTKIFKIYVGTAFGLVILFIAAIIFWNSSVSKNSSKIRYPENYSYRSRSRRRMVTDEENPLLKPPTTNEKMRRSSPPAVPPPDF